MPKSERFQQLPAPWDRIFSLTTRIFVWGLLILIIYILRPFFLLIFLTFVFAYVQSHGVEGLAHRFKSRVYRVIIVFLIFLGLIIGTLYFLAPHVQEQGQIFWRNWPAYTRQADKAIYGTFKDIPAVEKLLRDIGHPDSAENGKAVSDNGKAKSNGEKEKKEGDQPEKDDPPRKDEQALDEPPEIVQPIVNQLITGLGGDPEKRLQTAVHTTLSTVTTVLGFTSSFLLSILFSFLIVLDLPKLSKSVSRLALTKLDFIYEEVAGTVYHFGRTLGRALEAQLFIAICNTILTAIGISIMGLENIVFLSTIVFFCSFIPVAGVFFSSAPICLLALQSGGENLSGVQMMVIAIGLIMLIHFIEAYFLNPKIFGHHLRMNAVIVLIVLTVSGKLFGVWGLVLGLPMVNYVFGHAIRRRRTPEEKAAAAAAAAAKT